MAIVQHPLLMCDSPRGALLLNLYEGSGSLASVWWVLDDSHLLKMSAGLKASYAITHLDYRS